MAGPVDNEFLIQAATYLGATAIAVPLFKRLKLGTILGFLAAGVILGDHGLGLLHAEEGVFHVAELGVVLFLFVIGLELSFRRLWDLRKNIFGLGMAQMLITGLVLCFVFTQFNVFGFNAGVIAGFALACSSTAFALSLLQERGELNTAYGTKAFSILLFQDLAVIPLLAAIPFAAASGAMNAEGMDALSIARTVGVIAGLIIIGRFVLNHVFRIVAISGSREAFTAMALFVVAGTALAVSSVGLSMALGAFLAGVLLAESSFRHQIEADIEPFRELLLGLFFIGVGMQLNLDIIMEQALLVIAAAVGLVIFKMVVIFLLARLMKSDTQEALRAGGVLSQCGEFAFVVFSLGAAERLFTADEASLMSAIVTLTMVFTPPIMMLLNNLSAPVEETDGKHADKLEKMEGEILLVGFGRMGQIIDQVLKSSGYKVTTIDKDPKRIETASRFGNKVYFGDGHNMHLLLTAGATSANAIIFAIRDDGGLRKTVDALRTHCPKVTIVARAHDRIHEMDLLDAEIDHIVRETLESSLDMAGRTLSSLGKSDGFIADVQEEFRLRDRERLLEQKAGDLYAGADKMRQPFKATKTGEENGSQN
jgi:monovalent cation:proton antiporter-2 (CPA2) family protein